MTPCWYCRQDSAIARRCAMAPSFELSAVHILNHKMTDAPASVLTASACLRDSCASAPLRRSRRTRCGSRMRTRWGKRAREAVAKPEGLREDRLMTTPGLYNVLIVLPLTRLHFVRSYVRPNGNHEASLPLRSCHILLQFSALIPRRSNNELLSTSMLP